MSRWLQIALSASMPLVAGVEEADAGHADQGRRATTRYACPANGYVNCRLPVWGNKRYCSRAYFAWAHAHCRGFYAVF